MFAVIVCQIGWGEGFNNNNNNHNNNITSYVAARGKILVRPSFSVCTLRDAEKKTHKHKVLWEKRLKSLKSVGGGVQQ